MTACIGRYLQNKKGNKEFSLASHPDSSWLRAIGSPGTGTCLPQMEVHQMPLSPVCDGGNEIQRLPAGSLGGQNCLLGRICSALMTAPGGDNGPGFGEGQMEAQPGPARRPQTAIGEGEGERKGGMAASSPNGLLNCLAQQEACSCDRAGDVVLDLPPQLSPKFASLSETAVK